MAAAGMYGIDISEETFKAVGGNSRGNRDVFAFTEEDKEYLGARRNVGLCHLRRLCYALIVFSCIAIIIGLVSLGRSAPEFRFPYAYGGPCIAGFLCIITAILNLWLAREGRKTPSGDVTTDCFRCINTCQCMYSILPVMACVYGGVAEGMIGYIECVKLMEHHHDMTQMRCTPNTKELAALSIATIIICFILAILTIAASTICCCYRRAFGIKSGYEVLSEAQFVKGENINNNPTVIHSDEMLVTYTKQHLEKSKEKHTEEQIIKAEYHETVNPFKENIEAHINVTSGKVKVDYKSHHIIERNPAFIEVECSEKRLSRASESKHDNQDQMTERLISSHIETDELHEVVS